MSENFDIMTALKSKVDELMKQPIANRDIEFLRKINSIFWSYYH